MSKTRLLLVLYLLFVGISTNAQTSYIKGLVTDAKKTPIEYANVVLYDAADTTRMVKAAATDVKGRFGLCEDIARQLPLASLLHGICLYLCSNR